MIALVSSLFDAEGGIPYQVRINVSQYVILHATNSALSGSHMPRAAPVPAFEARSIGTNRMMLDGSARDRKTGRSRYAGVDRIGR
jgi:hypothetical protein